MMLRFECNLEVLGIVEQAQPAPMVVGQTSLLALGRLAGDANGDGKVSIGDLSILAANWGQTEGMSWSDGDFNGDGRVSIGDLSVMAARWGQEIPAPAPQTQETMTAASSAELSSTELLVGPAASEPEVKYTGMTPAETEDPLTQPQSGSEAEAMNLSLDTEDMDASVEIEADVLTTTATSLTDTREAEPDTATDKLSGELSEDSELVDLLALPTLQPKLVL